MRRRRLAGQTWQDFFNLTTEQCELCGLPLFKDEIPGKRCDACDGKKQEAAPDEAEAP